MAIAGAALAYFKAYVMHICVPYPASPVTHSSIPLSAGLGTHHDCAVVHRLHTGCLYQLLSIILLVFTQVQSEQHVCQ